MAERPLRADAFTSMSRILEAARRTFAAGDGSATLNRIAKDAGVGIATLYRHFPNREALARAVYDRLFADRIHPLMERLGRSDAPRDLLLEIAEQILDILSRERGLASSLGNVAEATGEILRRYGDILEGMVVRGQAAGNLRADLHPSDVPHLLTMIAAGFDALGTSAQARRRYLALLLDALNPSGAQSLPAT